MHAFKIMERVQKTDFWCTWNGIWAKQCVPIFTEWNRSTLWSRETKNTCTGYFKNWSWIPVGETTVVDPGCLSRIRNFFLSRIQGQKDFRIRIRIKELQYFNLKIVSKLSEIWSGMFIPDPDLFFLPIPDPGIKKAPDPDPQHWWTKTKRLWYLKWLIGGSSLFSPGPGGWNCGPRGTWPASCTGRTITSILTDSYVHFILKLRPA